MSDFSFTLPGGCKIGECTGENVKFAMGGIMAVSGQPLENGKPSSDWLLATDSRLAAFLPVTFEGEKPQSPVLLPPISVKKGKDSVVSVNGQCVIETPATKGETKRTILSMPAQEGRFPPVKDIMPCQRDNFVTVTLHSGSLAVLADAISGAGVVTLHIRTRGKDVCEHPILVVGHDGDDASVRGFGLMMPLTPRPDSREVVFDKLKEIPNQFNRFVSIQPQPQIA